jgi:hypothetical protein
MLSLDKYIKEDRNKSFMGELNTFKKRSFSVALFGQNNIDTTKFLSSQRLYREVKDRYKVADSKGEYLSMKLKRFY